MKQLILDYLKKNNLDIADLLELNEISNSLQNTWKKRYPIIDNIQYPKNEVDIFLKNESSTNDYANFNRFSDGLIELINENSNKKIEGPNYLGMFGWQSEDLSVSFGVNNEKLSFEARFTFRK